MGRSAHNYSSNKIPMLDYARDDYIACSTCIPELLSIPGIHVTCTSSKESSTSPSGSKFSDNPSTAESSVAPSKHSGEMDKSPALDLDALLSIESINGEAMVSEWAKNLEYSSAFGDGAHASLVPAPLRIRKSPRPGSADASPTKIPRPLPLLPANSNTTSGVNGLKLPSNPAPERSNPNKNQHSKELDPDLARAVSVSKYSVIALSFSSQINRNISSISSLITFTRKLQRAHQATRSRRLASFWSFPQTDTDGDEKKDGGYPGSDMSLDPFIHTATVDENKVQRIARLRAESWKTVGLRSKRRGWKGKEFYERFCSQALAELYEGEQVACSEPEQAFL